MWNIMPHRIMMKTVVYALMASILLLRQVRARDPETVRRHSINRCRILGVYRVDHEDPWWCCNCLAGHFKVANCGFGNPRTTKCEICPFDPNDSSRQTYTTRPNNLTECSRSINKGHCDNIRNVHWEAGSITKPGLCVCDKGYFASPDKFMEYGCNQHSPCEKGYEPVTKGSTTTNPLCKPCQNGTFSNVSSSTEMCQEHSKCKEGEFIRFIGNTTSDTRCSRIRIQKVKDGTWKIAIAVVVILIVAASGAVRYFWQNGCPCRTTVESLQCETPPTTVKQTSVHINKSFDAVDGSSKLLIYDKDESNIDTTETKIERVNETTKLETSRNANVTTSRADEIVKKDKAPSTILTIINDVVEFCNFLDDDDKDKELIDYTDWRETLKDLLKDSQLGCIMIYGWEDIPCDVLRPVIRLFLRDIDIKDIEENNKNDRKEIRHQWLNAICTKLGRDLTLEYLLKQSYYKKCFKDIFLRGLVTRTLKELKSPKPKTQLNKEKISTDT